MLKNIKIEGMHCMGCALGLEEELEKLDFVKAAQVSFENKEAIVECEEKLFDMDQIKSVVKQLGFKVEE